MGALDQDATLIVATHRPALLRIVDRLIVVNDGAVVMDGSKDKVIASLRAGRAAA